jgi:hypothetical protein
VDDEDFEELNQYKWCAHKDYGTFYAMRHVPGDHRKMILMHRQILGNIPDGYEVDHLDGNGLNNQRANLRIVSRRQNGQNRHHQKTSKFPGVYWHKCRQKWHAQIRINGKVKYLGLYETENDAFEAYRAVVNTLGEELHEKYLQEGVE